jgi:hypothetical protein
MGCVSGFAAKGFPGLECVVGSGRYLISTAFFDDKGSKTVME